MKKSFITSRPGPACTKANSPEVIKLFHATELSMKIIILINVKMPTIVGVLTFISKINKISENLKERKVFIFHHFGVCSRNKGLSPFLGIILSKETMRAETSRLVPDKHNTMTTANEKLHTSHEKNTKHTHKGTAL